MGIGKHQIRGHGDWWIYFLGARLEKFPGNKDSGTWVSVVTGEHQTNTLPWASNVLVMRLQTSDSTLLFDNSNVIDTTAYNSSVAFTFPMSRPWYFDGTKSLQWRLMVSCQNITLEIWRNLSPFPFMDLIIFRGSEARLEDCEHAEWGTGGCQSGRAGAPVTCSKSTPAQYMPLYSSKIIIKIIIE